MGAALRAACGWSSVNGNGVKGPMDDPVWVEHYEALKAMGTVVLTEGDAWLVPYAELDHQAILTARDHMAHCWPARTSQEAMSPRTGRRAALLVLGGKWY